MSESLKSRVEIFEEDVDLTHQLVQGDDNTSVTTENGDLPSFAKLQRDLKEDALNRSEYEFLEDYEAGIQVDYYYQLIRAVNGDGVMEFWRPSSTTVLPYTTTGAGMPEAGAFAPVGDAVLRDETGGGIRRVDSLSGLESTPGRFDGDAARLVSGTGRDGAFRWSASDLSSTLVLASVTSDSVDDTTDTINDADHPFSDGDGVITQTSVNGLTAQTVYWVVNSTSGSYQLSETFGGGAVDLTGTTNVTVDHLLDPWQGIYVTSSSDKKGASGAWVRQYGQAVIVNAAVNIGWFSGVGDAKYRDDSTGLWYRDSGLTILATDSTAAFMGAVSVTGGIDSPGTIDFGPGGFLLSPEVIDIDGIDIRQKNLCGVSPHDTVIVQSGNNTYQTFFRNGPRNLSEAGNWGSGGTFRIFDMYIRGNWDGSSDQQFIEPESGNGNGITGILKADYDFDAQGGVLQLISSTRSELNNVWVSHGYGHNIKYYRNGYGFVGNGRTFATRGSGLWALAPSASSAWTSSPIFNMKFETCRGEGGGLKIIHMWGTSITDCLFEGQPYGIYMEESGDVDTSGNYMEGHYYEDFYTAPEVWGITDIANYAFNQQDPRAVPERKGYFHYRRDSGLYLQTDTATYGTRPAQINGQYLQRNSRGYGIQPPPLGSDGGVFDWEVQQLSASGGVSLGWYTSIRHCHNDTDDTGAAEVRFRRNLNQNGWSAISFATYDGANLVDRWWVDKSGALHPDSDNTYSVGTAGKRASQIYAASSTINTSDANLKTDIQDIPQSVCDAAMELQIKRFKMIEAVGKKGGDARWHYGVVAQEAMAVFEKYGITLDEFGPICRDQFDEPVTMDGVEVTEVWGVRYEELNILIIEAMRRSIAK